jgi:phosphoribosylanthranilate isomerase
MTVLAKICGVTSPGAVAAAVAGGADMIGFVFFPPSPRNLTPEQAATLAAAVPTGIDRVGVFVDPDDATLEAVLAKVPLDLIQLHGDESPARVRMIREKFRLPVIKAIRVSGPQDVARARDYDGVADWLMFDSRAPRGGEGGLPGGNGMAFDWRLLAGQGFRRPWLLSGGLDCDNVAVAVAESGAVAVDVSSGVEQAPGRKDPKRIKAFLETVKRL